MKLYWKLKLGSLNSKDNDGGSNFMGCVVRFIKPRLRNLENRAYSTAVSGVLGVLHTRLWIQVL